jgi:Xaa-Pro aminopeptidase
MQISENWGKLQEAEKKALLLFHEIEQNKLICAGKSETQISEEILKLAKSKLGVDVFWHKRIVRAGKNTLCPYKEDPPDLILKDDDILFLDLGPVFEEWEADFGKTYVIGNDPIKLKLKNDIETSWISLKKQIQDLPNMSASEVFHLANKEATKNGWEFGGEIAGHLIGKYPHEKLEKGNFKYYIHPDNHTKLKENSLNGKINNHWILELHFVHAEKQIGAFVEGLLF